MKCLYILEENYIYLSLLHGKYIKRGADVSFGQKIFAHMKLQSNFYLINPAHIGI